MCHCAFFEQAPLVIPFVARAQWDGPSFHDLVLSFVDEACDQKLEPFKLPWDVQHEMVFRDEDRVAVCNQVCRIVFGNGIC